MARQQSKVAKAGSSRRRLRLVSLVFAAVTALSLLVASPASAASACYQNYRYAGYSTTYYHNRGIDGDVNYRHLEMTLYNNNRDHANLHLGVTSQEDPEVQYGTEGWIQGGWSVGYSDGIQTDTVKAYGETNGPNTGTLPDKVFCSTDQCPWGNRVFDVYWTGETDSSGRGLFYSTITLQYHVLQHAWLVQPTNTEQEAVIEGYSNDSSGYCPAFDSYSLFGTTGYLASWDTSTALYIYTNDNGGTYKTWTPADVATNSVQNSPYVRNTYNQYDAFQAYGGG